jgi:DNA-binding response OmpR family regulator
LEEGEIPPGYDLARLGWFRVDLAVSPGQAALPLLLTDLSLLGRFRTQRERAPVTLIGVDDPSDRARLLADGFGEALPTAIGLHELEERSARVVAALDALPRRRDHGRLQLDLLLRDGRVGDRRLGLHPREFALLWRLAETPGAAVPPGELLNDVWQLNFRPETNSLAVHVCRLRAKLAAAGMDQIVHTTPLGAYVLVPDPDAPAIPLPADAAGLDAHVRAAVLERTGQQA